MDNIHDRIARLERANRWYQFALVIMLTVIGGGLFAGFYKDAPAEIVARSIRIVGTDGKDRITIAAPEDFGGWYGLRIIGNDGEEKAFLGYLNNSDPEKYGALSLSGAGRELASLSAGPYFATLNLSDTAHVHISGSHTGHVQNGVLFMAQHEGGGVGIINGADSKELWRMPPLNHR